jgi:hypothetical protein
VASPRLLHILYDFYGRPGVILIELGDGGSDRGPRVESRGRLSLEGNGIGAMANTGRAYAAQGNANRLWVLKRISLPYQARQSPVIPLSHFLAR